MSTKTNALRRCDAANVPYTISEYEVKEGFSDGVHVADLLGFSYDAIFKTLVAEGKSHALYVFVIPVDKTLNLKKAAKVTGEKSMAMLPLTQLTKATGYVKGGCSPIGMKKAYPTFFDRQFSALDAITFNAGKVGMQVTLQTDDVEKVVSFQVADLTD